jgi:uncharacterized protein (TIGR00297 family)
MVFYSVLTSLAVNTAGFAVLIGSGKARTTLTTAGCAHAYALGNLLWITLGWRGWAVGLLFLAAGSAVTKVKMKEKTAKGIAEGRGGARGPENVWGSAATGSVCALAAAARPDLAPLLTVGFIASFATKLSDTAASELGKAYGTRAYLVTSGRAVQPGTVGAVSIEGTLAGFAGSLFITGFGCATGLVPVSAAVACLFAALLATNVESLLGATLQGRTPWLTSEVINFIMTLVGAAVGMLLWSLQRGKA